jgi:hypothetical protein
MKEIDLNDVIVDFETARSLRARGFEEPTNLFYQAIDLPHAPSGLRAMKNGETLNHNHYEDFLFSAPTYKEATNWLMGLVDNWDFKDFDEQDWASMHDCIYDATYDTTKEDLTTDELKKLFKELPSGLQADARRWGMGDTPWRDELYTWYKKNRVTA